LVRADQPLLFFLSSTVFFSPFCCFSFPWPLLHLTHCKLRPWQSKLARNFCTLPLTPLATVATIFYSGTMSLCFFSVVNCAFSSFPTHSHTSHEHQHFSINTSSEQCSTKAPPPWGGFYFWKSGRDHYPSLYPQSNFIFREPLARECQILFTSLHHKSSFSSRPWVPFSCHHRFNLSLRHKCLISCQQRSNFPLRSLISSFVVSTV
jgi:hypothetical protein